MILYPYYAPIILTDALYNTFGGFTGSSSANQRSIAYLFAEMQVTEHLGTFLLPTTVTGSYFYPDLWEKLPLEYGHVRSINSVSLQIPNYGTCELNLHSGGSFILDDTYGYIIIGDKDVGSYCGCGSPSFPLTVQVSYTAGLSSGSAYQPNVLLALTMAAGITLKEITDPGALEGGAGDIGVQEFSSVNYREVRHALANNIFGNSAVANKISKLLETIRHKRALRL